jgi:type VI protein secretion system component VasF
LTYIIRDNVLFVHVLILGFTGKYINLLRDLVGVLQATVPSNMSRLSTVVTGAVSSRTFVASLTVVSLVATLATTCTLVRVTLINVV